MIILGIGGILGDTAAAILRDGGTVPREDRESRCRIELGDVIHGEVVSTVAEAPRQGHLRTRPAARRAGDAEVQRAVASRPDIGRIELVLATAIAWRCPN